MSEVTAEMIENGRVARPRVRDPPPQDDVKMRAGARKTDDRQRPRQPSTPRLLRLFAQSHKSATPLMCLLVVAIAVTPCMWVPATMVLGWAALDLRCAMACCYGFSVVFLESRTRRDRMSARWRLKFIIAEIFQRRRLGADRRPAAASARPGARTFVLVVLLLSPR